MWNRDSSPTGQFTDTHFEDSSPTELKTVHRHIEDSSSTNFILYLYEMSQFSPFIDVIMNEGIIKS